jgi:hypothetical protein
MIFDSDISLRSFNHESCPPPAGFSALGVITRFEKNMIHEAIRQIKILVIDHKTGCTFQISDA